MSLLQQEELDDAARGEELTKGSSHLVIAALIAGMVVSAAIAIYMIAGQKPPFATGEITAVWVHPQHTETSGFDASGAPMAQQIVDEVLVFTVVKLHNQCDHPLSLSNVLTNATLDDGIHSSYAATRSDYDRVFIAYPGLTVPHGPALSPLDTTLDPGQTVEGTIVSAFKVSKEQWDARKKLDYTFAFRYQPNVVVTPHVTVIEQ